MVFLIALLSRLAPLLPQSWRAFAERQAVAFIQRRIARASPSDAARLLRLCDALVDLAQTQEEVHAAISFAHRTQNTLAAFDRSGHFNRFRPRRMRFTRRREQTHASSALPDVSCPRALDLSG